MIPVPSCEEGALSPEWALPQAHCQALGGSWGGSRGLCKESIPCKSVEVSEGVSGREGAVFSRMHLDFKQLLVALHPQPTADVTAVPSGNGVGVKGKKAKQTKQNQQKTTNPRNKNYPKKL